MKKMLSLFAAAALAGAAGRAQPPYAVTRADRVGGAGGFDYVVADSAGRRLYIPRGDRVTVFDLDTLQPAGEIPGAHSVHGAAVDPASGHGFCSSQPVLMWDARTLAVLKTIPVGGRPDGILFDPHARRIFILSHERPNATVIDARDGSIAGVIDDLGGEPEQGASDGRGRLYFDLENRDEVAVVDADSLKVLGHYGLGGRGGAPAGLALDREKGILFVCGRQPQSMVMLDAADGKILGSVPIGAGVDSACFNPATGEAFSSQRDGTLTVVREGGPAGFEVEQTVATRPGAKTSALDAATGRLYLITADRAPAPAGQPARRPSFVPGTFTILVVARGT